LPIKPAAIIIYGSKRGAGLLGGQSLAREFQRKKRPTVPNESLEKKQTTVRTLFPTEACVERRGKRAQIIFGKPQRQVGRGRNSKKKRQAWSAGLKARRELFKLIPVGRYGVPWRKPGLTPCRFKGSVSSQILPTVSKRWQKGTFSDLKDLKLSLIRFQDHARDVRRMSVGQKVTVTSSR